jgi:hypothetical protein
MVTICFIFLYTLGYVHARQHLFIFIGIQVSAYAWDLLNYTVPLLGIIILLEAFQLV